MRYFLIFSLLFFAPSLTNAQQPNDVVLEAGKRIFTEIERQVIRDVMQRVGISSDKTEDNDEHSSKKSKKKNKGKGKGKNKGMPPGLAKKTKLPHGLTKRDTLPHGLQKRNLPTEITRKLPPPPHGTERVIVDNNILLLEKGTDIVLDIIRDVITKR